MTDRYWDSDKQEWIYSETDGDHHMISIEEAIAVVCRVSVERGRVHEREAARWAPEYRQRTLVFKEENYELMMLISKALRDALTQT